ncbi:MAG: hypothetical protein KF777_12345 [Planctomycetaceae bacterium]|nr:hypothetical protein [Planctomycetaceae bacterium]
MTQKAMGRFAANARKFRNPASVAVSFDFRATAELVTIDAFVDIELDDGGYVSHSFEAHFKEDQFHFQCERSCFDSSGGQVSTDHIQEQAGTNDTAATAMQDVQKWFSELCVEF